MRSPRSRAKALLIAVALLSAALPVASAAAVENSQITTPAGPLVPHVEKGTMLTIAGTSSATAVDIRCYYGTTAGSSTLLASDVPVVSNAFSVEVETPNLPNELCQLRAVPHGDSVALPPGEKEPFEGPTIAASSFFPELSTNSEADSSSLQGSFNFQSAGDFGVESTLFSSSAHKSEYIFFGEVDLEGYPPIGTRSTLQVDGTNAYTPKPTTEVENALKEEAEEKKEAFTPPTGQPALVLRHEFETGNAIRIEEEDPIVECSPEAAVYKPTLTSCTSFVSAGVKLHRTWVTSDEDHVASMTDTWVSTNGAAHTVNARYYNEMTSLENTGAYQFPGEASFSETTKGQTETLPAGAGMILYKTALSLSELGNGIGPQGAIVYDIAPTEPLVFTTGSAASHESVFEAPYQRTIPAGGSATMRMSFVQAFGLPEVRTLAAEALAGFHPKVAITSPATGTTVTTPSVTVTGTASDSGAISSLSVNGTAVAVSSGGTWSASVALKAGANTVTATASDQAGLTSASAITITYTPPPPPKPTPATAAQVGVASGANARASFTLACHGTAGTSCKIHVSLTTIEKIRHGHLLALAAVKTHSKQVTVASLTVVIPAGQQIKIALKLNSTGRKLLARFGKLPAHLTATLEGEAGKHAIVAQNLTIKPKPKPKKHKH